MVEKWTPIPAWYYWMAGIVLVFIGSFIVAFVQVWWEDRKREKAGRKLVKKYVRKAG